MDEMNGWMVLCAEGVETDAFLRPPARAEKTALLVDADDFQG